MKTVRKVVRKTSKNYIGYLVKFRIEFKIICLVHRCIQNQAPDYLKNLLTSLPVCKVGLRSEVSNTFNLTIPKVKRETFAVRAFSVKGPILWNQLLNCIQTIGDFKSFKKHLKTFYFKTKNIVSNKCYCNTIMLLLVYIHTVLNCGDYYVKHSRNPVDTVLYQV